MIELGDRIRGLRKGLGLSQSDMQDRTGIAWSTIAAYEQERYPIPPQWIPVLARALNVEPSFLGYNPPDVFEEIAPDPQVIAKAVSEAEVLARQGQDIQVTLETVTPEMAKAYLAIARHNRSVPAAAVGGMVRALQRGQWGVTGDCIKFTPDGRLFDGRHRMAAVVISGIPMVTFVARNIKEDCVFLVDIGRKRTAGDALAIRTKTKNSTLLAAAARRLVWFALDDFSSYTITIAEVLEVIDLHPKLADSVNFCRPSKKLVPATLSVIHYIGSEIQGKKELADRFARTVITGEHSSKTDPAWAIRERADEWRTRWSYEDRDRTAMYAWNKYSSGKGLEKIITQSSMDCKEWNIDRCYNGNPPVFTRNRSKLSKIIGDKDETDREQVEQESDGA